MGCSASAHLYFGVPLEAESNIFYSYNDDYDIVLPNGEVIDEEQMEEYDDFELGDYLAMKAGLTNPYHEHGELVNGMGYEEYTAWKAGEGKWFTELTDAYYEAKSKLESEAPIEVGHAGDSMSGYTQPVLVLKGYSATSYWGAEIVKIPEAPSQELIDQAVEFCKTNNLPSFEGAGWVLAASYG